MSPVPAQPSINSALHESQNRGIGRLDTHMLLLRSQVWCSTVAQYSLGVEPVGPDHYMSQITEEDVHDVVDKCQHYGA